MAIARAKMVAILSTIVGFEAKTKRESRQPDRVSLEHSSNFSNSEDSFCYRAHLLGQQLGRGQFRYKKKLIATRRLASGFRRKPIRNCHQHKPNENRIVTINYK